ncbi:hypothetical protein AGMMS49942_30220 [Spirochaetia bacterium]|nr:hypothetical protein AGMMS49942_30220 [Spirochaetia bacterium]
MGTLEDRYEYDAFGKPYKGDFNSGMNLGYTGKPYDVTTGLYNYGYRDYKPEVARFTTVDPIRDGTNWFAYVNNDPANWLDLWGLSASDKINTDTLGKGILDAGLGAIKVGTGLLMGGPLGAVVAVDGWVQASVGLAEITGSFLGLSSNNNYPTSMSQTIGIAVDAAISAVTGKASKLMQSIGTWVGSQPVRVKEMIFNSTPIH